MALTQSGNSLTGTFTFQSGTTSTITGTVSGTSVTMSAPRTCADGIGTVTYTCTLNGSSMSCTMSGQNCLGCTASSGSILLSNIGSGTATLTKQ